MSLSLTHERSRLRGDDEVEEAATESYIVIIRMRPCQDRYGVGSHVGVLDKTTKWGATMYKRGRLYVGIPLTR